MKKLKTSFWHKPCLVLLLLAACIAVGVGSAWARYRTDIPGEASFEAREQATVKLWSLGEKDELMDEPAQWELVDGKKTLTFAVSNYKLDGYGNKLYSEDSQGVKVRLLASLGLNYTENVALELVMPLEEGEEEEVFTATATAIAENSPYHSSFGPGWVFEFEDEFGEELFWLLEGGEPEYIVGQVRLSGADMNQAALVQLVIESDSSKH